MTREQIEHLFWWHLRDYETQFFDKGKLIDLLVVAYEMGYDNGRDDWSLEDE